MPELTIYRDSIPEHFYYQAQAFSRIVWTDSENYDIDGELHASLIRVVLASGKLLISYAQVLWCDIELARTRFRCGGLNGVMTFPYFRKRGYGSQVVKAATAAIREDVSVDVALLWTAHENEHFYTQLGWESMPHMTTLVGNRDQPEILDGELSMMQFISQKGQQNRQHFITGRVYVGEETW